MTSDTAFPSGLARLPDVPTSRRCAAWFAVSVASVLAILGHMAWALLAAPGPGLDAATAIAIAFPLYLLGHLLRAARLFLLVYDGRVRADGVALAHVHAVAVGGLIPFKLGEVYRVLLLGRLLGNPTRALLAVWSERVYDICAVVAILFVLVGLGGLAMADQGTFLLLAGAFLFVSFFLFLVLPELLSLVRRYLLVRHTGERVLGSLRAVDRLQDLLRRAGELWRARFASVLWLSCAIWMLELTWIAALLAALGGVELAALSDLYRRTAVGWVAWSQEDGVVAAARVVMYGSMGLVALGLVALGLRSTRARRLLWGLGRMDEGAA